MNICLKWVLGSQRSSNKSGKVSPPLGGQYGRESSLSEKKCQNAEHRLEAFGHIMAGRYMGIGLEICRCQSPHSAANGGYLRRK